MSGEQIRQKESRAPTGSMISRATPAHVSLCRATRSFVRTELQLSQQIENSSGTTGVSHTQSEESRSCFTYGRLSAVASARKSYKSRSRRRESRRSRGAGLPETQKEREDKCQLSGCRDVAEKGDSFFGKVGARARARVEIRK
jgi:hypothetical protein